MSEGRVCFTCGTKYPKDYKGDTCFICQDDRQYVPLEGQKWTSTRQLKGKYSIKITQLKPKLFEFIVEPSFAIGQRALFVISESGNFMWDCIPLIDDQLIQFIKEKGGIRAIGISHPHYYSNMAEWCKTFRCRVYLSKVDKKYVVNPFSKIIYWDNDEIKLWDDIKIIKISGHFPGSSILFVPFLSDKGTVFCSDTFYLSPNLKHFSIMYSYPNRIPLPIKEVQNIQKLIEELDFDEVYGFWSHQNLTQKPKESLLKSLSNYV